MGLLEDFASIGFCGSCLIVPLIIVIFAITLFKPEIGAFYLKNMSIDKKRLYGAIIYTLSILVVLIIFSISMSINSQSQPDHSSTNSVFMNFIVSCFMASLFYCPILGVYIAYVVYKNRGSIITKTAPKESSKKTSIAASSDIVKNPVNDGGIKTTVSKPSDAVKNIVVPPVVVPVKPKPKYNPNTLVNQLTSQNENVRNWAAFQIKEQNEPLMNLIIPVCDQNYNYFMRSLSNQLHITNEYNYGILTGRIFENVRNPQTIPYLRNHHNKWIASLEGARLYLIVSSDSRQIGLLELIRTLTNSYSTYQLQAKYIVKLCGNEMVEPLLNHMKSPFPEVRLWAIILISVLEDVRSWEPIRNALNDESPMVRDAAADAMRQLRIPMDSGTKQVIKEIVKIPCKYCGTYIENTCTSCPSCGAPLGK